MVWRESDTPLRRIGGGQELEESLYLLTVNGDRDVESVDVNRITVPLQLFVS